MPILVPCPPLSTCSLPLQAGHYRLCQWPVFPLILVGFGQWEALGQWQWLRSSSKGPSSSAALSL